MQHVFKIQFLVAKKFKNEFLSVFFLCAFAYADICRLNVMKTVSSDENVVI